MALYLIAVSPSQLSKEESLGLGKDRKKFDIREEYYVSPPNLGCSCVPG